MTTLTRSTALRTTLRERKCTVCKEKFQQVRTMQAVCDLECAAIKARQDREKQERKEAKERKVKLKTRSDWMRETQAAVNAYVRTRDADLPCISCGRHHEGQWHAGHYLARGSHPHLALVEANLAKQCAPCNMHLSGNQLKFRVGLIARIGIEAVETLEADNEPRKHKIEDLKRIKAEYIAKLRALKETLCSL